MNMIENRICQVLLDRSRTNHYIFPQTYRLSKRDTISVEGTRDNWHVMYRLYATPICRIYAKQGNILLGIEDAIFSTRTTKRRINAIALTFDLLEIVQRDFIWYWSDGERYTGPRGFIYKPAERR